MTKRTIFIAVSAFCLLCTVGLVVWHWQANPAAQKPREEASISESPAPTAMTGQSAPVQIQGCAAYIQPFPGEELEPRVLPGASIETIRNVYGPELKHVNESREWEWKPENFSLQVWGDSDQKIARSLGIDAKPGRVIATPDGIELGKDTFATLLQKMKNRRIAVSEKMEGADGTWILFVSFRSVCNPDDWSEYSWYLDGTPAVDEAVGNATPFRSDPFLNKVVEYYSAGVGKQSIGDIEGQPSTHKSREPGDPRSPSSSGNNSDTPTGS